jgi:hypothetical protein
MFSFVRIFLSVKVSTSSVDFSWLPDLEDVVGGRRRWAKRCGGNGTIKIEEVEDECQAI